MRKPINKRERLRRARALGAQHSERRYPCKPPANWPDAEAWEYMAGYHARTEEIATANRMAGTVQKHLERKAAWRLAKLATLIALAVAAIVLAFWLAGKEGWL